ncbi:MAG: nucleotidyltransferase domain-containing protein [Prolixibacteraceae bacterium]|nr:nucleotidyltransferase domain-containing protein [Prolixibacteraceae bacterium]NLX27367.1 nucleotidyltransferase domain-containing protein [Bacteroidales bacterium]
MRLTKKEIEAIKKVAIEVFGTTTEVRLFGSRTNDLFKGGDIDLFISGGDSQRMTVQKKIEFLVKLKELIGDQKIDVVLDRPLLKKQESFYRTIMEKSLVL